MDGADVLCALGRLRLQGPADTVQLERGKAMAGRLLVHIVHDANEDGAVVRPLPHDPADFAGIARIELRERSVLSFRFGLADGFSRTLLTVGEQFGIDRDRIRLIEAKALRKLRSPDR